jgi:predicted TIM-barrel fold metal-dependent hydrolase
MESKRKTSSKSKRKNLSKSKRKTSSKSKRKTSSKSKRKNLSKSKRNPYSWTNLLKNSCSYVNDKKSQKNKNKKTKKLKKIALEEAVIWPTQENDVKISYPLEFYVNTLPDNNRLLDIENIRLKEMDKNNVHIQILSFTAPGIQALTTTDDNLKRKKCIEVNNYLALKIKKNPERFKAFATVPMSDPEFAVKELDRCITKLGMVGVLINGAEIKWSYNSNFSNGISYFYDSSKYDIFWKKVEELDIPVYFHPDVFSSIVEKYPDKQLLTLYKEYPILAGSVWGFSFGLSLQIIRIILSGTLDRFPKLKFIIGHMGELLVWFSDRFDHRACVWLEEKEFLGDNFSKSNTPNFKLPNLTLTEYLRKNFYITTSGWFSDDALDFVIKKVGVERVLFSIDYPYEKQSIACNWIDNLSLKKKEKELIAYKNAYKLLKL